MQSSKFVKKINQILNASSESFLLLALISLFAFPIVIAKSLEPVVASEESVVSIPTIIHYTDKMPDTNGQFASTANNESQNVLGAFNSVTIDRMLTVDEEILRSFDRVYQKVLPDLYVLSLEQAPTFKKVRLFSLKNELPVDKKFYISVTVPDGLASVVGKQKNVYINDKKYVLGTDDLPTDGFILKPNEEISVYIESSRTTTTKLVFEVKVN
jgi:hypothetical protein